MQCSPIRQDRRREVADGFRSYIGEINRASRPGSGKADSLHVHFPARLPRAVRTNRETSETRSTDARDYDFNANVKGLFFSIQKALPLMTTRRPSSLMDRLPISKAFGAMSVYSATKAAVRLPGPGTMICGAVV
jgi:NAD(P)-dependent dehydrogenase (short-subunit alcohol dehydrogenase family)